MTRFYLLMIIVMSTVGVRKSLSAVCTLPVHLSKHRLVAPPFVSCPFFASAAGLARRPHSHPDTNEAVTVSFQDVELWRKIRVYDWLRFPRSLDGSGARGRCWRCSHRAI